MKTTPADEKKRSIETEFLDAGKIADLSLIGDKRTIGRDDMVEATDAPLMDPPRVNCFVRLVVARPILMTTIVFSTIFMSLIVTMVVVRREGANIFGEGNPSDIKDIRTIQWDARELAMACMTALSSAL